MSEGKEQYQDYRTEPATVLWEAVRPSKKYALPDVEGWLTVPSTLAYVSEHPLPSFEIIHEVAGDNASVVQTHYFSYAFLTCAQTNESTLTVSATWGTLLFSGRNLSRLGRLISSRRLAAIVIPEGYDEDELIALVPTSWTWIAAYQFVPPPQADGPATQKEPTDPPKDMPAGSDW